MLRVVADLGNTRLKWARVDRQRTIGRDDRDAGRQAGGLAWRPGKRGDESTREESQWAISTVNPPVAISSDEFLAANAVTRVTWYDSAAQVPVKHELESAETAGADRALAVAAAIELLPKGGPGLVVSCGTALTIERITDDGTWQGGIIAPGLGVAARALHLLTAQLPMIELRQSPASLGTLHPPGTRSRRFLGNGGAVRELLARQADDMRGIPAV